MAGGQGPLRVRRADDSPASDGRLNASLIDPAKAAESFIETLVQDGFPRIRTWRGGFHIYGQGYYRPADKDDVRSMLISDINKGHTHLTMNITSNVMDQVKAMTRIPSTIEPPVFLGKKRSDDWPAAEIISAANGLVHLPSLVKGSDYLRPATPRFFTQNALQFVVDHKAPRPVGWLDFLNCIWADDADSIGTLQEWFGYCVAGGTWLQKILALIGPKRSGKGTVARVLRRLVGEANVAGPTLSSLSTNFGLWALLGKSLAIISDARMGGRADEAIIVERLLSISGEDALTIDIKNRAHITCKLPTRLMILSNELFRLTDSSGALASRLILLKLKQSFYGREDHQLTDKLLTELPGIMLWAVEGWQRLVDRGRIVQPDSAMQMVTDLEELGSPITAFVRDRCIVQPGCRVSVSASSRNGNRGARKRDNASRELPQYSGET